METENITPENYNGNQATYCPEDNKLRLYVGRVPREEYLKLRGEGWVALPKQRELGKGDFAATWTPERETTALTYAELIEDEDAGPQERAADRAERFADYREKRAEEAGVEADRFDAAPLAHGFQNAAKAERAAARHDRIGDRAVNAWEKAEYWQRRTAAVIGHALHFSKPGVRMGRIKVLEASLRSVEAATCGRGMKWANHLRNRLAYENQMLEAEGGRAGAIEMVPGGWLRGGRHLAGGERRIVKVNKSHVTGRVVSVLVRDNFPSRCNHYGNPFPDGVAKVLSHTVEVERMSPDAYRAPTADELVEYLAAEKAAKASRPKIAKPPLLNPTDEDAERLQKLWNNRAMAADAQRNFKNYGRDYAEKFNPSEVCRIPQAVYSALSKGSYARAETQEICALGILQPGPTYLRRELQDGGASERGPVLCGVRTTSGEGYGSARRVIVITDKLQKPLPASMWSAYVVPAAEETAEELVTA